MDVPVHEPVQAADEDALDGGPSDKNALLQQPSPGTATDPAATLDSRLLRRLLAPWYALHARELPWRGVADPYRIWVSEIMLQQTRVAAVIDHYTAFLERFPTVVALALAPESAVLAAWSGLGYYRRARLLHKAAQFVMRERAGVLPRSSAKLRTLPGIGDYTCAAIASIAFGESIAVVDGNVERVVLRLTGRPEDASAAGRTFVRQIAAALVPGRKLGPIEFDGETRLPRANAAGDHNQAMMELGATVCLPRAPLCLQCPLFEICRTRGEHLTQPRGKQTSRPIAYLLCTRKDGTATEVMLVQRPAEASLMPGMVELPPLTFDDTDGLEPILRLRHSITTTNFYVKIYNQATTLRKSIVASRQDRLWVRTSQLTEMPMTGLARKVLRRLKLIESPILARRPLEYLER